MSLGTVNQSEEARRDAPVRPILPDWPRLMRIELAAPYLGVSPSTFRSLNIAAHTIGRCVLWDRADLDRYADRLGNQPLAEPDRLAEAAEVERRFLERRRGTN
ncbi:hypothetical protein DF286_11855 [Sphingosinicella humi]|uniref:DNA-binding protein n=1 Tax=Allosphingosinicella humi TaxID=2068657 RepID=A0A2U2J565_9SPHN|nr:hypothetical protein DF286_11855 [Sphingosinicella humi]